MTPEPFTPPPLDTTLCSPCAEDLELFVDEELDEDGYGDEPAEFESVGARYA